MTERTADRIITYSLAAVLGWFLGRTIYTALVIAGVFP